MNFVASRVFFVLTTEALLAACATSPTHTVSCDRPGQGWDDCAAAAVRACQGATYHVVRRSGHDADSRANDAHGDGFSQQVAPGASRAMVISCKASP